MVMNQFVGEKIEVEYRQEAGWRRPMVVIWKGKRYPVHTVLSYWEDHGFGEAPPKRKKWFHRRHRVYYHLKMDDGRKFEIYWDRGTKERDWVLTKIL